jgi:hypothetical protein
VVDGEGRYEAFLLRLRLRLEVVDGEGRYEAYLAMTRLKQIIVTGQHVPWHDCIINS